MDIDEYINHNLFELSNINKRQNETTKVQQNETTKVQQNESSREMDEKIKEVREKSTKHINQFIDKKSKTINDLVCSLNEIHLNEHSGKKPFFKSIFNNKPNNCIQIECLQEFDLSNISASLEDLFTKDAIIVNTAFCSDLFHINLMKYITQYMSYLVFDNPHFHLVFKNMPFMKTQLYKMKNVVRQKIKEKFVKSGDIVNLFLELNFNIKNIEQLTKEEIELFKSKNIKKFQITFLVK